MAAYTCLCACMFYSLCSSCPLSASKLIHWVFQCTGGDRPSPNESIWDCLGWLGACVRMCVLECVFSHESWCFLHILIFTLCSCVSGGKNLLYVRKSSPPCEYETCCRTSSVNLSNTWVHDRVLFLALCVVLISVVIFAALYSQVCKFLPHYRLSTHTLHSLLTGMRVCSSDFSLPLCT